MSDTKKIIALRDLIDSADRSLRSAKKLLESMLDPSMHSGEDLSAAHLPSYASGSSRVVEGVFTGEGMLAADGNIYSVPYNYASKSKLVQGSRLKATIHSDGKILYKIIEEIASEIQTGILTKEKESFFVVSDNKSYRVLTAAVTFHKASVGDRVSVRVPAGKDATFAAIESLLPTVQ